LSLIHFKYGLCSTERQKDRKIETERHIGGEKSEERQRDCKKGKREREMKREEKRGKTEICKE